MSDTIRTIASLQSLLADNSTQQISPQDLRDMLVSLANAYQELHTFGFKDLVAPFTAANLGGVSNPTLATFRGGTRAYQFAKGDEVFVTLHTRHDTKPLSEAVPHVHWTTNGTNTGVVAWDIEYTIAKGHNQEAFPAPSTITVSEAASGVAWQHMVTEAGTGIVIEEPDEIILVRFSRNNTVTDTNSDNVFGLQLDLHYEVDRLCTPNKTPNFYV